MNQDRDSYQYWQYSTDWRAVPSPKYGPGIRRIVDLSHGLRDHPGPEPHVPPPAYAHVEPFGNGIVDRGRAFEHVRIEPFTYAGDPSGNAALITICTQMNPQLEGPFIGYLPMHVYGELDPKLKMIAKDPANTSLAQLVTNAAILRRPAEPGDFISLDEIKTLSAHAKSGDAILLNTGFIDNHAESYKWPDLEPGITSWLAKEKGSLIFGIDSSSVEGSSGGAAPIPNHMGTWENGGINLEGLINLHLVPTERCILVALPLKIFGLDAGPCRCFALYEEDGKRHAIDLSPPITANAGPAVSNPGFSKREPFADKNEISRRLRVDPFHVDNCLEDLGMFVTFNTHLGAHIEVPYGAAKPDIASYPIERLIGYASVYDVPAGPGETITAELLEACHAKHEEGNEIALIRTGYSDWNWRREDFYDRSPAFDESAARYLIEKGFIAVASDCAAVDAQAPRNNRPATTAVLNMFHDAGIAVASNLSNIAQIFERRPYLVLAPLRIGGTHAAPVRAIAIEWE